MTALVARYRNALDIFFDGSIDDFIHRPVVPQVDDFNPGSLEDAAHDVYSGVMAVKKRCCGHHPDVVCRFVYFNFRAHGILPGMSND